MTYPVSRSLRRVLAILLAAVVLLCTIACGQGGENPEDGGHVDYAASISLDQQSETMKQEVTVHAFVDGDTTHFNVPESVMPGGVLKARYLAVNTPESTGKVEEWGKTAANFTRSKLENAASILIESDNGKWNADSTGGRYLVWVWYKPAEADEYRNLNIELLQEGLAIASNSANNRYGETCMAAINQAKAESLHVHSDEKDPNFPYGEAVELTLKELRCNVTAYDNTRVAFEGVVTKNNSNTVYVEEYDPESGLYYGMTVYYGYALNGTGLQILSVGNRVRIVGTVQYYETGGSYQVSGLEYSPMRPTDPGNIQQLGEGFSPAYVLTEPQTFAEGKVTVTVGEENKTFAYAELALYTSVEMKDLRVVDVYTTTNEESSSRGAMTLTCDVGGTTVTVRTIVLYDENGELVTADAFLGETLTVRGLVDRFDGEYQIKVFSVKDITIQ
ncbi:MAG: thermonuclease family protein [Clostridia bacterium]|nr:thermonuclease family protein [Clostridia bacterium]